MNLLFRDWEVTPVYRRASLHFCVCFLMHVFALALYVSRAYVISLLNEKWGHGATATCVAPTRWSFFAAALDSTLSQ